MNELKNLIATGESSYLEFKSEQVKPEDLAKEIVSFLNFQGGKILLGEELSRLFQDSGLVHYETTPISNTSLKDLNWQKLLDYFHNLHPAHINLADEDETARDRLLENLDILSQAGNSTTVVGMLMFGLQPERFLPQSEVLFAHFKGNEIGDELLDRKSLSGPLPQVIEDAQRVLSLNLPSASTIEGMKRVEQIIFPDKVLRELIVNALLHRRWGLMGNVRIFLFEDRLEIHSPGRLPNGVTVEKMKESTHVPRNPILMKFLQDYHFVEKLGRGIPMVVREMKKLGGREPDFIESGEEFIVTLYRK